MLAQPARALLRRPLAPRTASRLQCLSLALLPVLLQLVVVRRRVPPQLVPPQLVPLQPVRLQPRGLQLVRPLLLVPRRVLLQTALLATPFNPGIMVWLVLSWSLSTQINSLWKAAPQPRPAPREGKG